MRAFAGSVVSSMEGRKLIKADFNTNGNDDSTCSNTYISIMRPRIAARISSGSQTVIPPGNPESGICGRAYSCIDMQIHADETTASRTKLPSDFNFLSAPAVNTMIHNHRPCSLHYAPAGNVRAHARDADKCRYSHTFGGDARDSEPKVGVWSKRGPFYLKKIHIRKNTILQKLENLAFSLFCTFANPLSLVRLFEKERERARIDVPGVRHYERCYVYLVVRESCSKSQ
jgi:hypothetical protein